MCRKVFTAMMLTVVMLAGMVTASASTIPPNGTTTIVPNKLTVSWEDRSRDDVTIDTFRIFGFNVAQLRTMVGVLDGTVSNLADGTYQIMQEGSAVGYEQITFTRQTEISYILNITPIRNNQGVRVYPNQPGWVFLPDYEYNWASVRDVINAMELDLIDVVDNPQGRHTRVTVRRTDRPGQRPTVTPPGRPGGWPHTQPSLTFTPSGITVSPSALETTPGRVVVSAGSLRIDPGNTLVSPGRLVASGSSLSIGFSVGGSAAGSVTVGNIDTNLPATVTASFSNGFIIVRINDLPAGTHSGYIRVPITRGGVRETLRFELRNIAVP